MKKCLLVLAGALLLAFGFNASAETQKEFAKQFWDYITMTNPYSEWEMFPGYEGIYPGQSPHGAYLKLYANEKAVQAARKGEDMPYGAILVKENYGKDKTTLMAVTPMYRSPGHNPDAGDWWWAKYGADGAVMAAGAVQSCIDCHKNAEGNDWRFTEPQ